MIEGALPCITEALFSLAVPEEHQHDCDQPMSFNPFGKSLDEIVASDLSVLRQVQEGWYIEYKSIVPKAPSIAKSISAFANHYGGWLFYGIEESLDGTNVAGLMPGIGMADLGVALERIRNGAINISPPPAYEIRLVKGPYDEIGLRDDHAVIIVRIPESPDAPHVHSSGRIYRRIGDASEPHEETDRRVLDLLWARGEKSRDRLSSLLLSSPRATDAEGALSYLRLFLLPDPLGGQDLTSTLSFETFAEIMTKSHTEFGGIAFDNVFPYEDGFIARQVGRNNPNVRPLTFRYRYDGSTIADIPLKAYRISESDSHPETCKYRYYQRFLDLCHRTGIDTYIIDLNLAALLLGGLYQKHIQLSVTGGIPLDCYGKVRGENLWRRVPFFDSLTYIEQIHRFGIPVIQDEYFFAPPTTAPELFAKIVSPEGETEITGVQHIIRTIQLFSEVAQTMGIAAQTLRAAKDEILDVFVRAVDVHRGNTSPE